ncbi:MAG: hypothetical protein IT423_08840 [Pirellulaceae bacterium]|nr:hypothetical protein [Pirellulaceae bacterium]
MIRQFYQHNRQSQCCAPGVAPMILNEHVDEPGWSEKTPLLDQIMVTPCKIAQLSIVLLALQSYLLAGELPELSLSDSPGVDSTACDELVGELSARKQWDRPDQRGFCSDIRYRAPAMIGDFFGGSQLGLRGDSVLDRLFIVADDLDAPLVLPANGSTLTVTEPGPVGIFSSSITTVQQLQALFRAGSPLPGVTLQGTINDNATLTTLDTIAQIQSQLGSTGLGYDIILLQSPPGTYATGVNAVFQSRNTIPGTTQFNSGNSGALIQGGADTLNGGEDFNAFYFYDYIVRFNTALADASSGGVGRTKIADGGSVLPQNRLFFRYNHVQNAAFTNSGQPLNRFTPGFERSWFAGLASIELRAPFATDATTTYALDNGTFSNGNDTRFGNLTLYAKALMLQTEQFAISGGLGLMLPTASDIRVNYANGTSLLEVQNQSVHLQPFLGGLYTPNSRFFAQGFVQYDAAASGNSVAINSTGAGLVRAGTLTDPNHLFFDAGIGYWLHRSHADRGLTGFAPMLEAHQTSSVQGGDLVAAGPFQVGNFNGSTSITSLVAGATLEFGSRSQLTAGYATPIGGGVDRQYDGAFQFNFNRLLGP